MTAAPGATLDRRPDAARPSGGVTVVPQSENAKTGPVAATYAAQSTCPAACPLRGAGCYAESGRMRWHTRRLNRATRPALDLAREEARAIDALPADRPLRVHVVGDCATPAAARLVGAAMVRYQKRGRTTAWTYTHAWRTVPASAWQGAAVLASCETPAQVTEAEARGYAAALIVPAHPGPDVYRLGALRVLPCPKEFVGGKSCAWCGLCARPDALRRQGLTIGFTAHGSRRKTVAALCAQED